MSFLRCILILFVVILIINISCSTNDIESTTIQSIAQKVADEIQKIEDDLKRDEMQLKIDRHKLEEDKKRIEKYIKNVDVIRLNVGGELMITTRETLTRIPKSILSIMFNGRWEHKLEIDKNENIFFDLNPILFRHLLDQLQLLDINNIYPPSQPSLLQPFNKMLNKLGLNQVLSSEKKNIITFNVGGQIITNRRTTFNQVSNSSFDTIVSLSKITNFNHKSDVFLDYNSEVFQHLINQLRAESFKSISNSRLSLHEEKVSFERMLIDLSIFRQGPSFSHISTNIKWKQNGFTLAGGNGVGNQLNQLHGPAGIYVDNDDQYIYIADWLNHRIVEWKYDAKIGKVVAGGKGNGNRMDQLNSPTNVIVDKKTNSFIICDHQNRRVIQWPRQNGTQGQTIISDIDCSRLTMDSNGDLYVSDWMKNEVRRWKIGETNGRIVAGGNGKGDHLNQLNYPIYIFVDQDYSVYVSDYSNHRVMKWMEGAKEGIVVAGGKGQGNSLTQLYHPTGLIVDHLSNVYVSDCDNHRVMLWSKGSKEGRIIVGGNGQGQQSNQFNCSSDLSFDRQGNLYVVDHYNHRVQKFDIDLN